MELDIDVVFPTAKGSAAVNFDAQIFVIEPQRQRSTVGVGVHVVGADARVATHPAVVKRFVMQLAEACVTRGSNFTASGVVERPISCMPDDNVREPRVFSGSDQACRNASDVEA
jgi:hypothetical protein